MGVRGTTKQICETVRPRTLSNVVKKLAAPFYAYGR